MYVRIVEASAKEGGREELESHYAGAILDSLEKADGCMFAALLRNATEQNHYVSMTIWKSEDHVHKYEQSGKFAKNLDRVRSVLEENSEWKVRLSEDHTIQFTPSRMQPKVKSFPVAGRSGMPSGQIPIQYGYLRVLSLHVKPDHKDEFAGLYNEMILPELNRLEGFGHAFLVDNPEKEGEMISLSIWSNADSVDRYEQDGKFDELLAQVRHTFGDLYQWKADAEEKHPAIETVTSQDLDITRFVLITGRSFSG